MVLEDCLEVGSFSGDFTAVTAAAVVRESSQHHVVYTRHGLLSYNNHRYITAEQLSSKPFTKSVERTTVS